MNRKYLLIPQPVSEDDLDGRLVVQVMKAMEDVTVSEAGSVKVACDGIDMVMPKYLGDLVKKLASRLCTTEDAVRPSAELVVRILPTLRPREARLIILGAGVWIVPIIKTEEAVRLLPEGPLGPGK